MWSRGKIGNFAGCMLLTQAESCIFSWICVNLAVDIVINCKKCVIFCFRSIFPGSEYPGFILF